ncbi:hypothetical protein QBC47DRAFT_399464 [Echria macrotheca]|uniref:RRM domain-containing protein n=1 Tax=Echria macrotheca TaxID=438768 RepID=A0AAJ0BIG3_9PEZI|nr:hypothetical protein QBC47DRAFT_399464 [Echria macrotheca]
MADEEFEIDVYGDDGNNDHGGNDHDANTTNDGHHADYDSHDAHEANGHDNDHDQGHQVYQGQHDNMDRDRDQRSLTPDQRPQQGVKRKEGEGSDERPVDHGSTTALMISELNWWITDDDIRGWVREAGCEDELKDLTFSEHKVNGKSKGQVYVEFTSQQAATAVKRLLDALNDDAQPGQKRHAVAYASPHNNPFRTLPKDAPNRGARDGQNRAPSGPNYQERSSTFSGVNNNYGSGFRGGRGGFNGGRGGMNAGGFNRNFQGGNMHSFNNNMGFNNPMGGPNFGGAFPRGGGMMGGGMRNNNPGMRGGRGGGMNNMMGAGMMGGGMPMGGMPGMPGGPMAGMGMMGGGMPGFQGMAPQFTTPFFGAGTQTNEWQNPHGTKRPRGE